MKRAFSSLGCPELTLEGMLALAARHHIEAVELRVLERQLDLPAYLAARYGTPARLAAVLAEQPAKVHSFSTSLSLARWTAESREQFLAYLPWADGTGVRWLRAFDGGQPGDEGRVAESLDWWAAVRRERGCQCDIMVETHDCLYDGAAIRRLLDARPQTALLWDAGNTWLHSGEDPRQTWAAIKGKVVHIHVKDAVRRAIQPHPWEMVLPGTGELPFQALMQTLTQDGYAGYVSLEWEKHWHPELPALPEALAAAEKHGWR